MLPKPLGRQAYINCTTPVFCWFGENMVGRFDPAGTENAFIAHIKNIIKGSRRLVVMDSIHRRDNKKRLPWKDKIGSAAPHRESNFTGGGLHDGPF